MAVNWEVTDPGKRITINIEVDTTDSIVAAIAGQLRDAVGFPNISDRDVIVHYVSKMIHDEMKRLANGLQIQTIFKANDPPPPYKRIRIDRAEEPTDEELYPKQKTLFE